MAKRLLTSIVSLGFVTSVLIASPAQADAANLKGAGSSFANKFITSCAVADPATAVAYNPAGSGTGRSAFANGTVDFGASAPVDIPFVPVPSEVPVHVQPLRSSRVRRAPDRLFATMVASMLSQTFHRYAYLTESYDTQQPDELTYTQAVSSISRSVAFSVQPPLSSFLASSAVLPSASHVPIPSTKCKEVPLCKALRTQSIDDLREATQVEVSKQQRLGALGTRGYQRSELPRDALTVEGHCL